jgi:hypothetical protein
MSGIKDLGRVTGEKGEKGDTYTPLVTSQDGLVTIQWKVDDEVKYTTTIEIPYYVPVKENGQLKFIKTKSSDNSYTVASFSIADELKGDAGSLGIEFKSALPNDADADPNTIYVINNTSSPEHQNVYGYDADGEPGKKWIILDSPIKFNDYLTIAVANERFTSIENSIETRIGQILEQQYIISELLGDITITNG